MWKIEVTLSITLRRMYELQVIQLQKLLNELRVSLVKARFMVEFRL